MIDILFYYYHLFYKKSKVETQPVLTAIFTLSVISTWIIFISLRILFQLGLQIDIMNKWLYLSIFCIIFLVMCWHYIKKGNGKKVIKQKPMLLNSNRLSVTFAIFYTLFPFILMLIQRNILKLQ